MIDLGKQNLLGVGIDAVDYEAAVSRIILAAEQGRPFAVSALAVHGVMTGVMDEKQRYRLNHLDLVVPDGQPVRWGLNWLHRTKLIDRVYGPDLMLKTCKAAEARSLRIGLFGGTPELQDALKRYLLRMYPKLVIAIAIPSRFRMLNSTEKVALIHSIRDHKCDLLMVGLGCPRQEIWAYEFKDQLSIPVLAVGAAFNFFAGTLRQAPAWMQRTGLEWLFRLVHEPVRLWKRYLLLNPYYLWLLLCQKLRWKKFSMESTSKPDKEILYG
jgi:exopolysaccharide biosynthesis WecB/TagA/CpsF family protein